MQEGAARNHGGAVAFHVWRVVLAVDELEAEIARALNKMHKSDLCTVGNSGEHRFAAENSAHTSAVESAAESAIVVVGFDGVCNAATVQVAESVDVVVGDPGAGFVASGGGGALDDDVSEGCVAVYGESAFGDGAPERM